jgi:uncharacterized protein YbcV (DUF1398 family)
MNPTANAATLNTDAIRECMAASFNDMPFPEVVRRLAAAGVERYRADLILRRKTYYGAGDLSLAEPLQPFSTEVADAFCEDDVKRAIAAIQQKQIGYREFLTRIMTAGVAAYDVFIRGGKAVYFGKNGDFHIEPFPQRA